MESAIETWYSRVGSRRGSAGSWLLAQLRTMRLWTRLWFDTLVPFTVALVLSGGHVDLGQVIGFIITANLFHWGATLLNDVQDAEVDRQSTEVMRRTRPIAQGVIGRRTAFIQAWFLVAASVAVASQVNTGVAVLFAVFAVLLWMHEMPPVRAQSQPVASQLMGLVALAGLLYGVGLAVEVSTPGAALPFLVYVGVYLGLAEMFIKDVRDADNDERGGKNTTAVRYGAGNTTLMALAAYGVSGAAWAWFAIGYPAADKALLWFASALLGVWFVVVAVSAGRLRRAFSKTTGRMLHRGSVLAFTVVNLLTIAALWR